MLVVLPSSGRIEFCSDLSRGASSTESNSRTGTTCSGRCGQRMAARSRQSSNPRVRSNSTTMQSARGACAAQTPVAAHFGSNYRQFRRAHALLHLYWLIPALLVYAVMGLAYRLRVHPPWDAIEPMSKCSVVLFAGCVLWNLLYVKELRLDFDRWYALVEANFTEPKSPSPDSRSAIMALATPHARR